MKKLLVLVPIAAFAAFAWWMLPTPEREHTAQVTASGKGLVQRTDTGRGVVQHVDKARGMVTIKHGALPALQMMSMTMSFPVRDQSQLVNLQPMQEVEFQLSYDGEEYVIIEIK